MNVIIMIKILKNINLIKLKQKIFTNFEIHSVYTHIVNVKNNIVKKIVVVINEKA